MKVGLILPLLSGDSAAAVAFARRAEALGYDGVFAFDHLFPRGGRSDRPSLEAFAMLSAVAAVTDAIAVGTLVTRASLRAPGMLAKMAASVDGISGGRMILGIGTGDREDQPEHEAYGLSFPGELERREHLIEIVRALRCLFRGEPWPGGERVPALAGPLLPPPATSGVPRIWVGGRADEVVRIAAHQADAWNGWALPTAGFGGKVRVLREAAAAAGRVVEATWAGVAVVGKDEEEARAMLEARRGRKVAETDVWAGGARSMIAWLGGLEAEGATWAVLALARWADRIDLIAEQVLPQVRSRP